jgi:hypothetical protein
MRLNLLAAVLPLMALPVAAYNLLVVFLARGFGDGHAHARLTAPQFHLRTAPGGLWPVSAADLLLAGALAALFVELIKARPGPRAALVNHALSTLVFVVCLGEMLLAPAFATSTFFLITLMVLLDVLAGFVARYGDEGDGVADDPPPKVRRAPSK